MYKRPRIIPCLTIQHQDLVKTIQFSKPRYIGDPINSVKIFNNKDVDELCVIDITATVEKREPDYDFLHEIASEAFMPLGYGGGIKTLEQAKRLFKIGYEKVIVNSLLFENPEEVKSIVRFAGSQSVVASIDYRVGLLGKDNCFIYNGKNRVGSGLNDSINAAISLGVGEILLTSINNDGCMKGYDIKTVSRITSSVHVPVIACGGAGTIGDLKDVFENGRVSAAAVGSFFIYYGNNCAVLINTPSEEDYLRAGIYEFD